MFASFYSFGINQVVLDEIVLRKGHRSLEDNKQDGLVKQPWT